MTQADQPAQVLAAPEPGSVGAELLQAVGARVASNGQAQEGTRSAAQADKQPAQAGTRQEDVPKAGGKTPQKVIVDWDGAEREVATADLVKAAREAEKLRATNASLEEMLTKNSAAQGLVKALDGMEPEDARAVLALFQDPTALRRLRQAPAREATPSEAGDEIDNLLGDGRKAQPAQAPQVDTQRLDAIENAVKTALNWMQNQETKVQKATLAQTVDETMSTFKVFEESEEGKGYARDAILREYAQEGGKAKLEDVVAKHATRLHKMLQGERKAATPTPSRGGAPRVPDLGEQKFTTEDFMSGKIGRQAGEMIRYRRTS